MRIATAALTTAANYTVSGLDGNAWRRFDGHRELLDRPAAQRLGGQDSEVFCAADMGTKTGRLRMLRGTGVSSTVSTTACRTGTTPCTVNVDLGRK